MAQPKTDKSIRVIYSEAVRRMQDSTMGSARRQNGRGALFAFCLIRHIQEVLLPVIFFTTFVVTRISAVTGSCRGERKIRR
jgi:hypothetical protein